MARTRFKVAQLNAENLFLNLDEPIERDWTRLSEKEWQRLSRSTIANKPLLKTLRLARDLLAIDADVICVNEVGGLESLTNFARFFLGGRYAAHLIEGNSDRGIDVGFLLRADLPVQVDLRTHKSRPLHFLYPHERGVDSGTLKTHYFSRDCAELRLFKEGDSRPSLILLAVHLKSKLDPDGIDPQGKERRRAEFNTLMDIYREVRAEFSPPVPVVLAGDFNGAAARDQLGDEFKNLTGTDLLSVLELSGKRGIEAATQIQNRSGQIHALEIDFIMISPDLRDFVETSEVRIFRYLSELGVELPIPKTLEQRASLPSDHYPIVATFRAFF